MIDAKQPASPKGTRLVWFVLLYVGGVATVGVVALLFRLLVWSVAR